MPLPTSHQPSSPAWEGNGTSSSSDAGRRLLFPLNFGYFSSGGTEGRVGMMDLSMPKTSIAL
jgi:hypothetical protein